MLINSECACTEKRKIIQIMLFTLCIFVGGFLYDGRVFDDISAHIAKYILVKIVYLAVCFIIVFFFYEALTIKGIQYRICRNALPYLLFEIMLMFYKNVTFLIPNTDEAKIYDSVRGFDFYPAHFTYIMGLFYALSVMMIPYQVGVILVKIILQALICGYCVERSDSKWAYVLFVLRPVEADYTLSVHRMPIYGVLYLFLFVKLFYDSIEKKTITKQDLVIISVIGSVLMIWRKEGIYFLITLPLLLLFSYTYKDKMMKKKNVIACCTIMLLMFIPELLSYTGEGNPTAEQDHTYNAFFVNMRRLGLEEKKYQGEFEKIDKVISIEIVDKANKVFGDENYESEIIAYKNGYIATREDVSATDHDGYMESIRYIVIHEPLLFLKSRIGMWHSTSFGHGHINKGDSIPRIIYHLILFNYYVPLAAVLTLLIISIHHRNCTHIILLGGLILHSIITFLLAPTSFFKYYYQLYLVGWFILIIYMIRPLFNYLLKLITPMRRIIGETGINKRT